MFVILGTLTADVVVKSAQTLQAGDDGFKRSNLVFTEAPLTITMGGNGGNSAYVLAGLGEDTALGSAVGQDMLGDALVGWLAERGVYTNGIIRSDEHATSSSTIIMSGIDHQVVFHHLGATPHLTFADLRDTLFSPGAVDGLLITSYPLMRGLRHEGYAQALKQVHDANKPTLLDIGPAIGESVTLPEIIPLLPYVDYLLANTHELQVLTGDSSWEQAATAVISAGGRHLVIKQGADGASLWTQDTQNHVPAFAVPASTTIGAGDSFNAGLIYALQRRWSPQDSLRFAHAVAAMVIQCDGGIFDAPSVQAVQSFLVNHT